MVRLFVVYLGEPVAVKNRPVEGLVLINVGEVFESDHVNVFICPPSLFITNQPGKRLKTNNLIIKMAILLF